MTLKETKLQDPKVCQAIRCLSEPSVLLPRSVVRSESRYAQDILLEKMSMKKYQYPLQSDADNIRAKESEGYEF